MCRGPAEYGHGGCHRQYWFGHTYSRCLPPLVSIEDEIKMLENMKEDLEKRLKAVEERLEKLKS
ncbi:MAG: DUF5320 domain-containing protein [Candidatus Bathyarchaeia archaeon]